MADDLQPATDGAGPLLQRDYWAVFAACTLTPRDVVARVRARFCELPPEALVHFDAPGGLTKDAELDIRIRPAQSCRVRVIHEDANSFTLGTLVGHPEAGRITFGAYRNAADEVVFHIRSRARSSSVATRLGFLAIGDALQTMTWTDFINNAATLVGATVRDVIQSDVQEVEEQPEDGEPLQAPTYLAVGD